MVAPARSPTITVPDAANINDTSTAGGPAPRRLTRSQVADQLEVSISTVRRLEGTRLHPEIGPANTRLFDPAEVAAVAAQLARSAPHTPEPKPTAVTRGELAARVFERFEQRHSLAEIVIELRVAPDLVRNLFHQWRIGLEQGEALRRDAVPPDPDIRDVSESELRDLLASLRADKRTRISVARIEGDEKRDGARRVEVVELGGFWASGPVTVAEIAERYGWFRFRLTAADEDGCRHWEVSTPYL